MAKNNPGIWRAVADAETYDKRDVMMGYKTVSHLQVPTDVVRWVKRCGSNACLSAAALNDRGANCVAEMIITVQISMIPSIEAWEGYLRDEDMLEHELLSTEAMRRTTHYLLDVYEGGNVLGIDRIELAADVVRATQLFDPGEYAHLTKDGGKFTELCQRLLDSLQGKDKVTADRAFYANNLDLYALAREPRRP